MRKNLKIWHPETCVINDNAEIGDDVVIHPMVVIYDNVKIGDRCKIQSGTFIPNGITIGNDCFIGPRVIMTNDKKPPSNHKNWEKIIIEDGVSIGAGTVILPGIIIGSGAMIGAGSIVTKSIPSNEIWYGHAAIPVELKSKYPLRNFGEDVDKNFANFISGFVDGEGSFSYYDNFSSEKKKYLSFCFSLESDYRDREIYNKFKDIIKCGNTYERRRTSNINKVISHLIVFQVRKQSDLMEKIIPFFDTYQFNGFKKIKYQRWREKILDYYYDKEKNKKYYKINGKYKRKEPFYKKKIINK